MVRCAAYARSCCWMSFTELEPRKIRDDGVDMFIDLGATIEDHGEVSFTSSAGEGEVSSE